MSLQTAETSSQITVRVVTFPIGTLTLAIPIESVYRVLSQITIHGSGERGVGVAHLEDFELTVFDLEYHLFIENIKNSVNRVNKNHVIVVQSQQEIVGLQVKEAPSLKNIPRDQVRVLPDSYRKADTLHFCSHVAILEEIEAKTTIFLLDVERLLPQ